MGHSGGSQARLVAREAGGTGAAQIVGAGLRYVSILCLTRILGAGGYGAYALTLTVTGVANVLSALGLSPGVLPFLSRARKDGAAEGILAVARAALILGGLAASVLTAAVFFLAPWFGESVFHEPRVSTFLRPLCILVFIGGLLTVVLTLLQGFMAVKQKAWIERVVVVGVTASGMALTLWFDWGIPGVLVSAVAGPAAGLALGWLLLSRRIPELLHGNASGRAMPLGALLDYSWPLMGTTMLSFLLLWTDVLLMGVFRTSEEVGVYGVCARLAPAILLVHESVGPVFAPRLSDLAASDDWPAIRHLYRLTARWSMWPGMAIAWGLSLWAPFWLGLFGDTFRQGAAILCVLALAKAVSVTTGMCGKILSITGRTRLHLVNMILLAGGNLALNILWIPRYGGMGAATATCVSLFGVNVLQTAQVALLYRMIPWDARSLLPLFGTAALAALVWPLRGGPGIPFGWVIPAAAFLGCCALLFRFLGFTSDDREVWNALRQRLKCTVL